MMFFVVLQASPSIDAGTIVAAIEGRQWALLAAIAIYAAALLIKQGWLGAWLQAHLPPRALPFLAPLAGIMFLSSGEMITGTHWLKALVDGLMAGFLPLIGHEMFVESMRSGKEPIPKKDPPSDGGGLTDVKAPGPIAIGTISKPPGPTNIMRTAAVCIGMSLVTLVTGCAAASAWWQQLINNPAATIADLINSVRNVLTTADTVWALLSPLLGPQQAAATQIYSDAKVSVVNALAALQNAVNAAAAAKQDKPDWASLTADVQGAVANLIAIVQQYAGSNAAFGSGADGNSALKHAGASLSMHGASVASWGKK